MRWWASSACVLVMACGDNQLADPAPPIDAALDAPADAGPDPFAGMFDDPADFPRTGCVPGSVTGFAHVEYWPELGIRTSLAGGLRVYVGTGASDEERVAHVQTADDLFVRSTTAYGALWILDAIDICRVDADGTLHGARVLCTNGTPCLPQPFRAAPLHRLAGEADGLHLTVLGETGAAWAGASTNVRVVGDYAYLSRLGDGVRIVSIADPAAPVEVGHVRAANDYANDLKVLDGGDGARYVVTASTPANVIDVTVPAAPAIVAQLPFSAHSVFVEGQTVYLVDGGSAAVEIWDLARPRTPRRLRAWTHPDGPTAFAWHDIFVSNRVAYLSDIRGSGLHVVDFTDLAAPVVRGGERDPGFTMWHSPWLTTIGGRRIALDGTEGASRLRLLDGDPGSPTFLATLGEWQLRQEVSMHNVMAHGDRAYVAHYRDGIRVLDLSDPAAPVMVGYYNTWVEKTGTAAWAEGAWGLDIDVARKRIYVADSTRGLIILQGDATSFP